MHIDWDINVSTLLYFQHTVLDEKHVSNQWKRLILSFDQENIHILTHMHMLSCV